MPSNSANTVQGQIHWIIHQHRRFCDMSHLSLGGWMPLWRDACRLNEAEKASRATVLPRRCVTSHHGNIESICLLFMDYGGSQVMHGAPGNAMPAQFVLSRQDKGARAPHARMLPHHAGHHSLKGRQTIGCGVSLPVDQWRSDCRGCPRRCACEFCPSKFAAFSGANMIESGK